MTVAPSKAAQPSVTAGITCAQRAAEALQPAEQRLFHDPFASHFLQRPISRLACRSRTTARLALRAFDRLFAGFHAEIMLRNRIAEDHLRRALEAGVDQIVNLGAGYDTSAFRIDLGSAVLYEVDAPATQALKRWIIWAHGLVPKNEVVYVPCDFEHEALGERLADSGFKCERPSLVMWMGVSFFLSPEAAHATLADIAALCAPGSTLVWDYMDEAVVDGTTDATGALRARKIVARRGEPYSFGLTQPNADAFVQQAGFSVLDHARTPQMAARFGGPQGVWCRTDDFMGVIAAERSVLT
jgi:methyltransferase (TIGR00027 family)